MTETLWHFGGLEVRVEEVDAATAEAHGAEQEARNASASQPLLHVFVPGGGEAFCGVALDEANAGVSLDLLALSQSQEKCPTCMAMAAEAPQ
jgi:hypothetical protein